MLCRDVVQHLLQTGLYSPVHRQIRDQSCKFHNWSGLPKSPRKWARWPAAPVPTTQERDRASRPEKQSSQDFHLPTCVLRSSLTTTGAAWVPLPVSAPAEVQSTMAKPPHLCHLPRANHAPGTAASLWQVRFPILATLFGVPSSLNFPGLQLHGCDSALEATGMRSPVVSPAKPSRGPFSSGHHQPPKFSPRR